MKLIIAEKPELGQAIAEALSQRDNKNINKITGGVEVGEYTITWVFGHMLRLKDPEEYNENLKKWSLEDLPIYFENWEHVEDSQDYKKNRLKQIKQFLKQADEVINAGDPDDEGQYLIDEILEYFNYKGKELRVLINDNNAEYIIKAFNKLEDNKNYKAIGKSAYARAVADYTFGINLSRFFTLKGGTKITVGRVQTPTLGLVINRDLEIENHKKIFYYNFEIDNSENIKLSFNPKEKIEDENIAENIKNEVLNNFSEFNVYVKKEIIKEYAPLPFNLAELQSEANKILGYSPKETMEITQNLREKYKAITYNRSDCQYLGEENFTEAPEIIEIVKRKLNINTSCINLSIKSKAFDDSKITAHHGIIPTKSNFDFNKLSEKEKDIYKMITNRYLM
ncbi:DNA topoisomerase [Oceanivirga miroungae]|uniref:Omega-protein n=1 Tax=Oceanivirga miroungae TaxID=1130046 RepID=A0A6I8MCV5_9FUSO|nr:DNA topoisomerase [Oceanivirga miroungae]